MPSIYLIIYPKDAADIVRRAAKVSFRQSKRPRWAYTRCGLLAGSPSLGAKSFWMADATARQMEKCESLPDATESPLLHGMRHIWLSGLSGSFPTWDAAQALTVSLGPTL